MLNPNPPRSIYTDAFAPPPGMFFQEAIATTFSMDPALLLEVPIHMALMATGDQAEPDPLAMLKAIRRYSKKVTVYVQKGRIQIPDIAKPNPLFGMLENLIVEVAAPNGGVFHPKVWAIRFANENESRTLYRLVVLTRNLTRDQSWDLSLQLEGEPQKGKTEQNKALAHFFKSLPTFSCGKVGAEKAEQAKRFANDLHRMVWELPTGYNELTFYLPGTKRFHWKPPHAKRMAIISPFCSDNALKELAKHTSQLDALITRPDTLSSLKQETLDLFSRCLHLDTNAESEDGSDITEQRLFTGLHAKAYLLETRYYTDYTHVIMGSANATNAALNAAKNVEILVELKGKKQNVGGIDDLLGSNGMGEYLVDYEATEVPEIDTARLEAEKLLEQARLSFTTATLTLFCEPCLAEDSWSLRLSGDIPALEGVLEVTAWPITVTPQSPKNILDEDLSLGICLGEYSAASITGLLAIELHSEHPDVSAKFVLNIPVSGIPSERDAAILKTVINNQDGFFRYLLLLLGEDSEAAFLSTADTAGQGWWARLASGENIALLEDLTRSFSRYPQRLSDISRLIGDLSKDSENTIIPENFLELWQVFETAMGEKNA